MTKRLIRQMQRLALLALTVTALLTTGLAHRAPASAENALQVYVLLGGSMAEICGDSDGDGRPDQIRCPACQIAGSADLPPAPMLIRDAGLRLLAEITAPRASTRPHPVLDPARGSRAPPLA